MKKLSILVINFYENRSLFESFWEQEELVFGKEVSGQAENGTYLEPECGEHDDALTRRDTIRGEKRREKENKKEKQQQEKEVDKEN